jgi:hypothetical protein
MNYPLLFQESDSETQLKIVEIGTYIYFNGKSIIDAKTFKEKEQFYTDHIKEMKLEYATQTFELQQKYEKVYEQSGDYNKGLIENGYNMLLVEKDKQLDYLKVCVQELHATNVQNISDIQSSHKEQIEELKFRNIELEKENLKALDISTKLDNLVGKKSSIDNAQKGDFGETVVHNQILYNFPCSVIQDTSGQTAKGDLLWSLGTFKALVEVKNVQYVRVSDVKKFERDIQLNVNDDSCNCGLFVSLKTDIIQSKGGFSFEFLNGVPVIYVSNVFVDTHVLRLALHILYNVQINIKQYVDTSDISETEQEQIKHYLSEMN